MHALLLQSQPVIIHLEPPQSENATAVKDLTKVIVGSLGLTGAFVVVAVVVGLAVGAVLYWMRSRESK